MIQRLLALIFSLALAIFIAPSVMDAQQAGKLPRIGVTLAGSPGSAYADALRRGLTELGWVEGQNIVVEYRYAEGKPDRYRALVAELIGSKVDLIVAGGGEPAVRAAKQATSTIPIVMPTASDPVAAGLVSTLARPGGNVTGLSMQDTEISAKHLELLRELLPKVERVAVLLGPAADPAGRAP